MDLLSILFCGLVMCAVVVLAGLITAEPDPTPVDDFGNPLEECRECGDLAKCAAGLCWWCAVAAKQQFIEEIRGYHYSSDGRNTHAH